MPDPIVPPGPFSNQLTGVDVGPDGAVWASTAFLSAGQTSAVNRLDPATNEWTVRLTREEPEAFGAAALASLVVGPENNVYIGTGGDGLIVIDPDGGVVRYDETNSSLGSAAGPSFINVSDVAFEGRDRWVANRESQGGFLHLFDENDVWTELPRPAGISGGNNGRYTIAIDRLGQKWVNVATGGLVVWNTGSTPADPADDQVRQYRGQGESSTGLPDSNVRDVVVDGDGTVWIGTRRGLATVFSPGSAFAGDPSLAVPQWTLTPAGPGGEREFFLRDVEVNDLDVDPSGRVWVATTSGAYLVQPSPTGSGYIVAREINSSTSPLSGDNVLQIAVRASDGRVFLTTPEGLFSLAGDATQPTAQSESLRASPSPFRPAEALNGVVVSGLASARSTVRVLTLSGERIHQAEVAGGSFRWNGRDDRTGEFVSSGVYIVTATDEDGQAVVGKIAVIR